jgi:DNA-directed RNA polymerase subunit RPC12/RpoP
MWVIEFIKRIFNLLNRKGYFQEPLSLVQMIDIKCVNPKCTAPDRIFEFDMVGARATRLAKSGEIGSESLVVRCPYCGTLNKVFLFKEKQKIPQGTSIGITKRPPPSQGPTSGYVDFAF